MFDLDRIALSHNSGQTFPYMSLPIWGGVARIVPEFCARGTPSCSARAITPMPALLDLLGVQLPSPDQFLSSTGLARLLDLPRALPAFRQDCFPKFICFAAVPWVHIKAECQRNSNRDSRSSPRFARRAT